MPKGLPPPNHTQTPNIFFDDALPQIKSLAELKIILIIARQTFGWHKTKDKLSISRLQKLTGLTRQGVVSGTERAINDGFVLKEPDGDSFSYSLVVVNNLDYPPSETSERNRLEVVNEIDQRVVNDLDTQKKGNKEKKEKTAHALLMEYHASHLRGSIPDPAAQGKAAKELLAEYSMEAIKECYERLLGEKWRSNVTLLTVRKEISQKPRTSQNGHAARTYEWQGRYYALDEVISDDGERYTIMGADGTPSKRWHTLEAFAKDKGITLEQAKHGMSA